MYFLTICSDEAGEELFWRVTEDMASYVRGCKPFSIFKTCVTVVFTNSLHNST